MPRGLEVLAGARRAGALGAAHLAGHGRSGLLAGRVPRGEGTAHPLQLLLGRHLLGEEGGLDAVEEALRASPRAGPGRSAAPRRTARSRRTGRAIRLSSSTSSGARPALSSSIERRWISASRVRPASSSGALRTSSRRFLIIDPMRMTLAGCSTRSAGLVSRSCAPPVTPAASPPGRSAATPIPSWVTTMTRWPSGWLSCSCVIPAFCNIRPVATDAPDTEQRGPRRTPAAQRPPQGQGGAGRAPHGRSLGPSSSGGSPNGDSPSGPSWPPGGGGHPVRR